MNWLFSQVLVAEYSEANSLDGRPSAQLNVMPTRHPFWREDKTTDFSLPSQFGLTCAVLTAPFGEGLLTWFRGAFLARTSAVPAKAQALRAPEADSGVSLLGSFAKWDRSSSSWKTLQCSLLGGWESFSETWPRWGTMRDGACSAQSTPARLTSGSESGLLATPLASNTKANRMRSGGRPARSYLPTPRSTDGDRGGRGDLIQAVRGNPNTHYKLHPIPTPTVNGNYNRKGLSPQSGDGLATFVEKFPTPQASDNRDRGNRSTPAIQRRIEKGKQVNLSMCVSSVSGSLNPTWVEWLMGWPLGWTDLKHSATDKFQQWQHSHGQF